MIRLERNHLRWATAAAGLIIIGAGLGWGLSRPGADRAEAPEAASGEREVLYWYDPTVPDHRFDRPG